MRGHLRKRVESRRFRILRKEYSHGRVKDKLLVVSKRRRRKLPLAKKYRTTRMGSISRHTGILLGLAYNSLVYKNSIHRLWGVRHISILRWLTRYFVNKSLYSFTKTRSSRWFFSNKFFYWKQMARKRRYYFIKKKTQSYFLNWGFERKFDFNYVMCSGVFYKGGLGEHDITVKGRTRSATRHLKWLKYCKKIGRVVAAKRGVRFIRAGMREVGYRVGRVSYNRRSRRNRLLKEHYSLRSAKYRNNYASTIAARWSKNIISKATTRYRLELILTDDPILLAPKMFDGTGYRQATMNTFFYDNLGSIFTYIYTTKTYMDRILVNNRILLIKTFSIINLDKNDSVIKVLDSEIDKFNKLAIEKLKMTKNKNKPDYCYYIDSKILWNSLSTLEYEYVNDFDIIDILANTNYHTMSMCFEVYRIVSTLVYYSAVINS